MLPAGTKSCCPRWPVGSTLEVPTTVETGPWTWGLASIPYSVPTHRKPQENAPAAQSSRLLRLQEPFGFLRRQPGRSLRAVGIRHDPLRVYDPRAPGGRLERPDTLDAGSITMTGLEPEVVVRRIRFAMDRETIPGQPADYSNAKMQKQVVNWILSTAFKLALWSGLRLPLEGAAAIRAAFRCDF